MAAELTVLSAGAVEPGLARVIEAFRRETARQVRIDFATAPEIRKRIAGGAAPDVIIAPAAVLDDLDGGGERASVGRIGIGVAVRAGAPAPEISTVDAFKQSLRDAESVVYNRASTGTYLEALFARLSIAAELEPKTTRYADFAAVRDHLLGGRRKEIGLGATTVIIEARPKGLEFAGPLPAEIQNYTAYAATIARDRASDAAREFVRYLAAPAARAALSAAGIG